MGAVPTVRQRPSFSAYLQLTVFLNGAIRNYGSWKAHTPEEWISILSLATRWDFNDVRALAIQRLQALDMSPIERICIAHEYDISGRWVLAAYIALCERPEPLTLPEASRLGLETAMRIAQLREQLRAGGRKSSRFGGYHTLTRSAAARHGAVAPTATAGKSSRTERVQWGIGKSFLDQHDIPPPVRITHKHSVRKGSTAIPGTARLVAEAFGIDFTR